MAIFASVVVIYGQIIESFGWKIHFFSYGIIALVVIIIAFNIKDKSYHKVEETEKNLKLESSLGKTEKLAEDTGEKNIMRLFKNPNYIFILFITLLIFIPNQMVFMYLAPLIKAVGGNSVDLGYTYFFNALSEAPIFFAAKYFLERYKINSLLLFSAFFYLLRFIIIAAADSPMYFLFFGMLQSLSYGVFLVAVRYYIKLTAPDALKTTAQCIALMSAFGIAGIIGSLLGGYLIDNFGIPFMFKIVISLAAVSVMILIFVVNKNPKGLEDRT